MHFTLHYLDTYYLTLTQPTSQTHKHNNEHKHQHHEPPRWPASRGFNFIGEFDHPILHGGTRSKQHSIIFFYLKLNAPLFYWILFCIPLNCKLADINTCVFIGRCIESTCTNPSCPWENVWLLLARHSALRMQWRRAPMDWESGLRWLGLTKGRKEKKWDLRRDLQKPFGEFITTNSMLMTKC